MVSPRAPKRPRSGTEVLDDASSDDDGLDGLMGTIFHFRSSVDKAIERLHDFG